MNIDLTSLVVTVIFISIKIIKTIVSPTLLKSVHVDSGISIEYKRTKGRLFRFSTGYFYDDTVNSQSHNIIEKPQIRSREHLNQLFF